ncbi:Probable aspartyl protease At4g16563 [Linum perenne]
MAGASSPAPCIFCQISGKSTSTNLLHTDDTVVAFQDVRPSAFRHYLVIPVKHIATVNDLRRREEDYTLVNHMLQVGRTLLQQDAPESKHRFGFHQPPFNSVNHLHLHCFALPFIPNDYTLSITLNSNPPRHVSLYLDTGSDLVWFPCHPFECILCEGKSENQSLTVPANLTSSSAAVVTCQSAACSAAHSNHRTSDLCAIAKCPLDMIETSDCQSFSCPPFYYAYGDGSLVARLYTDAVKLPLATPSLEIKNFTFGCAHTALAEPVGVAGFGPGVLSLPVQLAADSPQFGNRFSYCLVSHSFDSDKVRHPSPLILGQLEEKQERAGTDPTQYTYTSLIDNPKHPYFYTVGLEGISVGKTNIPAPNFLKEVDGEGMGGLVVDSGTTFTMLPVGLYNSVVSEFVNRVGRVYERAKEIESNTGLSPCYYYNDVVAKVPSLVLHFSGNGSSVALPRKNYFYEFVDGRDDARRKRKVGCLMLMNGGDEEELSGGPAGTLGNYQQQGFEVVYDLEKRRVGFGRRECASLWESLNQG